MTKLKTLKKNKQSRNANVKKTNKQKTPPCGLCGKSKKPRYKTECCGNWVCSNEEDYVMFSYSRDICSRNHRRYTLCGFHHVEGHKGDWKTCKKCYDDFKHELETYVWYGTNEYNFEKLVNPPKFKPTHCSKCGEIIILSEGGYSKLCDVYRCYDCPITEKDRKEIIQEYENKKKSR